MVYRKKDDGGGMLPLEADILGTALLMQSKGESEFYPYALAKKLRDFTNSRFLTAHGTLYKALYRMEERGLVTSRWEEPSLAGGRSRRRLYTVTAAGAAELA